MTSWRTFAPLLKGLRLSQLRLDWLSRSGLSFERAQLYGPIFPGMAILGTVFFFFGIWFWISLSMLLCFSAFSCCFASLLFCVSASPHFCLFAFLLLRFLLCFFVSLLFCFSAFLLLCFSVPLLLCFSALCVSAYAFALLLFYFSALCGSTFASVLLCLCFGLAVFLLFCFFLNREPLIDFPWLLAVLPAEGNKASTCRSLRSHVFFLRERSFHTMTGNWRFKHVCFHVKTREQIYQYIVMNREETWVATLWILQL